MVDILNIPELGKLEIVEVYEYYDQPVLYSCKNTTGFFYLVVAADEDDQYSTWLCAAVSTERLNRIRSGKIDLHDAFAHAENTYLIQVKVPYDQHASVQVDFIQSNQISENMLPVPGEYLDFEIETLPMLSDAEEIVKLRNQEILNLTLNFAEAFKTQAPIAFLSNIFGKLQDVMNTIGMVCFNSNQITEEIRHSMQISLLQVGTGSFDIRLASPEVTQLDIFGNSACGDAIEVFFELLNAKNNHDKLKELVERLRLRVVKNYTEFLKVLNESVVDTKFTWKSVTSNRGGTADLSSSQMQEVIEILQRFQEEAPAPRNITGILIGASLKSKRFEIETTDEIYAGKIIDEAIDTVKNATLSKIYTATIQEITTRSEATGEITKTEYQLLNLRR